MYLWLLLLHCCQDAQSKAIRPGQESFLTGRRLKTSASIKEMLTNATGSVPKYPDQERAQQPGHLQEFCWVLLLAPSLATQAALHCKALELEPCLVQHQEQRMEP